MLFALVVAVGFGCAAPAATLRHDPPPSPAPTPFEKPAPELVPGTRVRLAPPPEHEPGRGFLGYSWPELGASLIVIEMPGPYAEVVAGFDAAGLEKGGMKVVEAREAKVCGRAGKLVLATQESQGMRFMKWLALCGDEKRTLMLNAVFPEQFGEHLSPLFEATLLGAEWDPKLVVDPFAPLPWTLSAPKGLRFAGNLGTTLAYTEDGEFVQKERPKAATFMVSPSMGEANVGDRKRFAEMRVRGLPVGKGLAIESSLDFPIDGAQGWEIVATARKTDDVTIAVHQVIVVREGEYLVFVGQCGVETRDTWLPRFRASVASWKPKPEPPDER